MSSCIRMGYKFGVGAVVKITQGRVAVGAKYAVSGRPTIPFQPLAETIACQTSDLFPVSATIASNVVNAQEFNVGFSATGAKRAAVGIKGFEFKPTPVRHGLGFHLLSIIGIACNATLQFAFVAICSPLFFYCREVFFVCRSISFLVRRKFFAVRFAPRLHVRFAFFVRLRHIVIMGQRTTLSQGV